MKWKSPPQIKIYEALGCIADNRVEVQNNSAKVYSSSRNKFYDVSYDPKIKAIMANDNGSYWKEYLGYPSIAFLMKISALSYDKKISFLLRGVPWKDINQKFKNDFEKTLEHILSSKSEKEKQLISNFVDKVYEEIKILDLSLLGKKTAPPDGY